MLHYKMCYSEQEPTKRNSDSNEAKPATKKKTDPREYPMRHPFKLLHFSDLFNKVS